MGNTSLKNREIVLFPERIGQNIMKNSPRHIGIIPDGNRRWAKEHGMNKHDGYEHGLQPGLKLLHQAKENGIEELTYYGFTVDNCKRPAEQFKRSMYQERNSQQESNAWILKEWKVNVKDLQKRKSSISLKDS